MVQCGIVRFRIQPLCTRVDIRWSSLSLMHFFKAHVCSDPARDTIARTRRAANESFCLDYLPSPSIKIGSDTSPVYYWLPILNQQMNIALSALNSRQSGNCIQTVRDAWSRTGLRRADPLISNRCTIESDRDNLLFCRVLCHSPLALAYILLLL